MKTSQEMKSFCHPKLQKVIFSLSGAGRAKWPHLPADSSLQADQTSQSSEMQDRYSRDALKTSNHNNHLKDSEHAKLRCKKNYQLTLPEVKNKEVITKISKSKASNGKENLT